MRNKYSDDLILEVTGGTNSVVIRDNLQVGDTITTDKLAVTSSIEGDVTHNGTLTSDAVTTAQLTATDAEIENLTVDNLSAQNKIKTKVIPLSNVFLEAEATKDGTPSPTTTFIAINPSAPAVAHFAEGHIAFTIGVATAGDLEFYIDMNPWLPFAGKISAVHIIGGVSSTNGSGVDVTIGAETFITNTMASFSSSDVFTSFDISTTANAADPTHILLENPGLTAFRNPSSSSLPFNSNRLKITATGDDDFTLVILKIWFDYTFNDNLLSAINVTDSS
jgi:hypothetical protein